MAGTRSRGEGSITYDKRRKKPYRARVTVGWELNEKTGKSKQVLRDIGSFKTKGEAARALADYLKSPYDLANKDITFKQLYEIWFKKFKSGSTTSMDYRAKSAFKYCSAIHDKKFREITILDMKDCIYNGYIISPRGNNKGEKQFASSTTKQSMKFLFNHMYAYAMEARLVEHNYAKDFALDKSVEKERIANRIIKIPLSREQMDKLWACKEFVPFADMVLYACYSGWRAGELIELKVENVNLDEGYIVGGKKTKAGIGRTVPIHPLVEDIVEKYYDEAVECGSEYLFNDMTKKKGTNGLSYDQYNRRFKKVMAVCGFSEDITPHYTRHTFITKAKSREVSMNEYILKTIVGHEIYDITEYVYTHRTLQDLKEEMAKIKS